MSSFHPDTALSASIDNLLKEGRYRSFSALNRICGQHPKATNHGLQFPVSDNLDSEITDQAGNRFQEFDQPQNVIIWCSNDYLGMSQHEKVVEAAIEVIKSSGVGAGGTRNIAGTSIYHIQLEDELASLHQKDAALIFNSGYMANFAALSVMSQIFPNLHIISDSNNHSSMIEGIRNSRSAKTIWKHNDIAELERILKGLPPDLPKLIAFESVYSMDGDFGAIEKVCQFANKYSALTYLDEVHAVGMYGATGAGLASMIGLTDKIDIIQGTLAKAYASMGGYIAANKKIIDVVRSYASGFIFTSSLAPVLAASAMAAIRHLKESSAERDRMWDSVRYMRGRLIEKELPFIENNSHIIPVLVGDPKACRSLSDNLLSNGHYVQPINYPTVKRGTERLRFTPGSYHTKDMIDDVVSHLDDNWSKAGLRRGK